MRVNFNFTPVLVRQILELVNHEVEDTWETLSRKPAAQLNNEDHRHLLENFFKINWDTMVRTVPRYAELLAKRGANVAITARNLGDEAQAVRQAIEAAGRKALLIAGDLTQQQACVDAVEQTVKQLGRLDVLVHNAGGPSHGRIDAIGAEQWLNTMALHVNAAFFLC